MLGVDAQEQDRRNKAQSFQRLFSAEDYLDHLLPYLHSYGITRLADVTGLDRVGIPVVQAIRPLARSNAVNQGKGLTLAEAAVSAVMEALETFAGEQADNLEKHNASARETYGSEAAQRLHHHLLPDVDEDWLDQALPFLTGTDVLSGEPVPVPAALVSTDYTPVSPHANAPFQRSTTGLGAGATPEEAQLHGLFESLERYGTNKAVHTHGFFEKARFEPEPFMNDDTHRLVQCLEQAGLLFGVYECTPAGSYPVIWARLLDEEMSPTSLPYHADGFACRETIQDSINAALLEAIQTRASVIAGGREDITWHYYPRRTDEDLLAFERKQMRRKSTRNPAHAIPLDHSSTGPGQAFQTNGQMTIAVPLIEEPKIPLYVTRVVTLGIPAMADH